MNRHSLKHIRQTFTPQFDQSDCGVACLLSIVQYYDGYASLEDIRVKSGTSKTGTTLLGLSVAATGLGFLANGCQGDLEALAREKGPVLIHVTLNNVMQHYMVCYGSFYRNNRLHFLLGDPGKGIIEMRGEELEAVWKSKVCLLLKPVNSFVPLAGIRRRKIGWFKTLLSEDYSILKVSVILGIVIAGLGTSLMIFSQQLIDHILPKKEISKLVISCVLVFLLLLAKEVAVALRSRFLIHQAKGFNLRIVHHFFSHLLGLPTSFFESRKIGEFSARLNDTARIQRVISQLSGSTVIDSLVSMVLVSVIFVYSLPIGAMCVAVLPFYFLLIYRFNRPIRSSQREIMANYAFAEANYISTFQGIDQIKTHNKERVFTDRNQQVFENYLDSNLMMGKTQIQLSFLANLFGTAFLISVLLFASFSVLHGTLKIGYLVAIIGMCSSLLNSIANLALVAIPLNEAKIAFNRMFEYTSMEPEAKDGVSLDDFEELTVTNISFRFVGRPELFRDVSFNVRKNEIIGIMGENGSGKSTIGKILQKKYPIEKGQIMINGDLPLSDISIASWRRTLHMVEQNPYIFNGNILENIAFEEAQTNLPKLMQFLDDFGLKSFIESLPQSYMTVVGDTGVNLSGGQKQIVSLARALYNKPQILILDETNAALDRVSEEFVLGLIQKIKKQTAIIFITHRLHVLKSVCDRIYVLSDKTISNSGDHTALLNSKNLYSEYWKDLGIIVNSN